MASPNYGYEKRQRELAKKKKKEEKLQAKSHRQPDHSGPPVEPSDPHANPAPPAADGGNSGTPSP